MANSIIKNIGITPTPTTNNSAIPPEMLSQLRQFKNTFQGNPKQAVMNMLSSGQITNTRLQQVMNMAKQFKGIF